MKLLVPQGLGDSVWSMFKIPAIAARHAPDEPIEIRIACWWQCEVETRSLEFMRRFNFVSGAEMYVMPMDGRCGPVHPPDDFVDQRGRYIYIPSGPTDEYPGIDFVAIANGHLERGGRLEDWLPEYPIDWTVTDRFRFTDGELAFADVLAEKGRYAVLYFGPKGGNTTEGHNRGPIWTPHDWAAVANGLHARGLRCVAVGASYDRRYLDEMIDPLEVDGTIAPPIDEDFLGCHEIGQTMAVLRRASVCVSYQSGIGIMSSYFGVPTAIFWRPDGDSINPGTLVSFDETMASAWVRPDMIAEGRHLPCIYGRHGPDYVLGEIDARGWLR